MKALVIGATGSTGSQLIQQLMADHHYDHIIAFVRKPVQYDSPKVQVEVINFDDPNAWKHLVKGDVAFSCLGTTLRDAGSKTAQWRIDYDYQLQFAKMAKTNKVDQFVLVSSNGASSKSSLFYQKMKGQLDDAIKALDFPKLTIFKPGMLQRPNTKRFGEKSILLVLNILNSIGILNSQKPLPTSTLAKAMIKASKINEIGYREIVGTKIFDTAARI